VPEDQELGPDNPLRKLERPKIGQILREPFSLSGGKTSAAQATRS
jgi:hypothetical protein